MRRAHGLTPRRRRQPQSRVQLRVRAPAPRAPDWATLRADADRQPTTPKATHDQLAPEADEPVDEYGIEAARQVPSEGHESEGDAPLHCTEPAGSDRQIGR